MFCYFPVWSTHKNFSDINWASQPVIEDKKHMLKISVVGIFFLYLSVKFHFSQFCHWALFVRLLACGAERVECLGPTIPLCLIYLIPKRKRKKNWQAIAACNNSSGWRTKKWMNISYTYMTSWIFRWCSSQIFNFI